MAVRLLPPPPYPRHDSSRAVTVANIARDPIRCRSSRCISHARALRRRKPSRSSTTTSPLLIDCRHTHSAGAVSAGVGLRPPPFATLPPCRALVGRNLIIWYSTCTWLNARVLSIPHSIGTPLRLRPQSVLQAILVADLAGKSLSQLRG